MRVLAGAVAATLLLAAPAIAQETSLETYPQRSFGAWSVYGFQGDCWMVNEDVEGASVSLSTNSRDTDLYIAVSHPDWTGVVKDANIAVRLSFAGFDQVRVASGLPVKGRGFSLFLAGADDAHLAILQAAPKLGFAASKVSLEVPLVDAGPAFNYMRQCTSEIRK
jgi:hypothetical protein